MDTSLLDTGRAAHRAARTSDELSRLALEVRRCALIAWESPAASIFRERIAHHADRLETLSSQAAELVATLHAVEETARARAAGLEELTSGLWEGMRP